MLIKITNKKLALSSSWPNVTLNIDNVYLQWNFRVLSIQILYQINCVM